MRTAFTLSEVLVTLTILGILASIVVPNVVNRYHDRQQITGFKRAWALLENALQEMYVVEGKPTTWAWPYKSSNGMDSTEFIGNSNFFAEKLAQYLPVEKFCGSNNGCFPDKNSVGVVDANGHPIYMLLTGNHSTYGNWTEANNYGKMKLKNGMAVSVGAEWTKDEYKRGVGVIRVDINGNKGPNRYGYDVFFFVFDDNGIESSKFRPYMLSSQAGGHKERCSKDSTDGGAGKSCSMWIMKHNNMKYKYKDVSAEW